MFRDLRREHGVRSYLAHNMTVTPSNLDQIEHVVADVSAMGFSMLSFQPAAHVGDERRWTGGDYRTVGIDDVWEQLEAGLGQRVAWQALQFGDTRCNRSAFGIRVDDRWVPMFEPDSEADLDARDRALAHFGGVNFGGTPPPLLAVKVLRVLARHPGDAKVAVGWARRLVERSGGARRCWRAWRRGAVAPMTYVVHDFMDAADVAPAWAADAGRPDRDRPGRPGHPGTTVGMHLRDGAPRDRRARPRMRPALGPRPGRERAAASTPPAHRRRAATAAVTGLSSAALEPSLSADVDHPAGPDGPRLPRLLIFDVNETLSDMSPMAKRFEDVGAPAAPGGHLVRGAAARRLRPHRRRLRRLVRPHRG